MDILLWALARRAEGFHDRKTQDKGKHDACHETRRCAEGELSGD